jgi:hypothetical protein
MISHRIAAAWLLSIFAFPVAAHEFWMAAEPFSAERHAPVIVTLNVGEQFSGEAVPFSSAHAAMLKLYDARDVHDLRPQLPPAPMPQVQLAFPAAGTQLLAFDSYPSRIELPADKFHAYLHDEGLDAVIRARERSGRAASPGRERYRRNVKALLRVGGVSDGTYAARTGQRLELVPDNDPLALVPGGTLSLALYFEGKPLADALLKAWHRQDGRTLTIRTRTDAAGKASFVLPFAGTWMISAVHMVAAEGVPDVDWDSFWANLTFDLRVTDGAPKHSQP